MFRIYKERHNCDTNFVALDFRIIIIFIIGILQLMKFDEDEMWLDLPE